MFMRGDLRRGPCLFTYSIAAARPMTPAMFGVPASNLYGSLL